MGDHSFRKTVQHEHTEVNPTFPAPLEPSARSTCAIWRMNIQCNQTPLKPKNCRYNRCQITVLSSSQQQWQICSNHSIERQLQTTRDRFSRQPQKPSTSWYSWTLLTRHLFYLSLFWLVVLSTANRLPNKPPRIAVRFATTRNPGAPASAAATGLTPPWPCTVSPGASSRAARCTCCCSSASSVSRSRRCCRTCVSSCSIRALSREAFESCFNYEGHGQKGKIASEITDMLFIASIELITDIRHYQNGVLYWFSPIGRLSQHIVWLYVQYHEYSW